MLLFWSNLTAFSAVSSKAFSGQIFPSGFGGVWNRAERSVNIGLSSETWFLNKRYCFISTDSRSQCCVFTHSSCLHFPQVFNSPFKVDTIYIFGHAIHIYLIKRVVAVTSIFVRLYPGHLILKVLQMIGNNVIQRRRGGGHQCECVISADIKSEI